MFEGLGPPISLPRTLIITLLLFRRGVQIYPLTRWSILFEALYGSPVQERAHTLAGSRWFNDNSLATAIWSAPD